MVSLYKMQSVLAQYLIQGKCQGSNLLAVIPYVLTGVMLIKRTGKVSVFVSYHQGDPKIYHFELAQPISINSRGFTNMVCG